MQINFICLLVVGVVVFMRKINFSSCAVMDNKIWFVTNDNDFICMDIFSGEAHYVMPRGNKVFNGVINTMVKYKRKIYWVEQNGERLLSYDVDTMFCKTYMLNGINAYGGIAFCSINIIGNKLVLLPKYNDEIIIFDLEEETFSERKNIFSKYISFSKNGYVDYVVLMNECVYIFLNDGFTIIKYDLEEDEISTILQESKRAHVYSSCLYKNSIIDLDCEGNIWFSKNDFQIRKNYY